MAGRSSNEMFFNFPFEIFSKIFANKLPTLISYWLQKKLIKKHNTFRNRDTEKNDKRKVRNLNKECNKKHSNILSFLNIVWYL
jgi:hypothetical protein